MGKAALEGLPGVSKVTRGFMGGQEINTVFFDADKISLERLTQALQNAKTYRGLAAGPFPLHEAGK